MNKEEFIEEYKPHEDELYPVEVTENIIFKRRLDQLLETRTESKWISVEKRKIEKDAYNSGYYDGKNGLPNVYDDGVDK